MRDALTRLATAQQVTATAVSANTYDAGGLVPKRDLGDGEELVLVVQVDVDGDVVSVDPDIPETYEVQAIQSANADLSSPDVLVSHPLLAAELLAGSFIELPIPWGVTKRYIGARFVVAGTAPDITLTAFLQPGSMASKAKPTVYQDAVSIR